MRKSPRSHATKGAIKVEFDQRVRPNVTTRGAIKGHGHHTKLKTTPKHGGTVTTEKSFDLSSKFKVISSGCFAGQVLLSKKKSCFLRLFGTLGHNHEL